MNRKFTHLIAFTLLFFSVSTPGMQGRRMPLPVWAVVFDLDSTVRSISSGLTVPTSTPREGRPITVMVDVNDGTGYARIRSTDVSGLIPATITDSNAAIEIPEGAQYRIDQIGADSAKPDGRHWYIVGSGKVRITGWDVVNNITPHS